MAFGSFFGASVADLLAREPWEGLAPLPPRVTEALATALDGGGEPFGLASRPQWLLDADWCYINHGAFGGCLQCSVHAQRAWSDHCESQPLRFLDRWA